MNIDPEKIMDRMANTIGQQAKALAFNAEVIETLQARIAELEAAANAVTDEKTEVQGP